MSLKVTQLLLATRNEGKRFELESILSDLGIRVVSLRDYPELPDVDEDGETFGENARKKALHFSALTGLPSLADDSGLEIDALEGWPGVYSARIAGSDPERIQKVLLRLKEAAGSGGRISRRGRFVCAICASLSGGTLLEVEGSVSGKILDAPRGERGFGYDPIFYHPETGLSFAEMLPAEKNRVSHRGSALERFRCRLRELLSSS